MPDPLAILRLAALVVFIGLVAVGLWLLDVVWWVVPPVMAVALLIAWTIEWLAWRGSMTTAVVGETAAEPLLPPPAEPSRAPVEAIVPPPRQPEPAPRPQAAAEAQPAPPPEPEAEAEPEPAPASEPPPPEEPPEPVAPAPRPQAQAPPRDRRRPRRMRLRPVPAPRPQPQVERGPEPTPPSEPTSVVAFRPRTAEPRSWNLWDLERIAREERRVHPERRDEWAYLFLHLRQFAQADGSLPPEFDGLVRESFRGLLERSPRA